MNEMVGGTSTTEFRDVVELRTGHGTLFTEDGVQGAVFLAIKSVPNGEDSDDESKVEEVLFAVPADVAASLFKVLQYTLIHPSIMGQLSLVAGGEGGSG